MIITVKEMLTQALTLVERGWVQGRATTTRKGIDHVCAIAAIGMIEDGLCGSDSTSEVLKLGDDAVKALRAAIPGSFSSVIDYNDHSSTTKKDVINLFKRAIDSLPD